MKLPSNALIYLIGSFFGVALGLTILYAGYRLERYVFIHYGNHIASDADKFWMAYHGAGGAFVRWDDVTYFRDEKGRECKL